MGCTGVPLYKIYQRKTQWRTERPPEAAEDADTSSGLVRNDSVCNNFYRLSTVLIVSSQIITYTKGFLHIYFTLF